MNPIQLAGLVKRVYPNFDMTNFSDRLKFEIIKLKGHSRSITKDIIHKIFSNVDRGSRKALRDYFYSVWEKAIKI